MNIEIKKGAVGFAQMTQAPETDALCEKQRYLSTSNEEDKIDALKLASKLERERDKLRAEIARLKTGVPRISETDESVLAEFLKCDAACVDHYLNGTMVVILRQGEKNFVYSDENVVAELRAEVARLKSDKARMLMDLDFISNISRCGVITQDEKIAVIYTRASEAIGPRFDSYKTQLDLIKGAE